jgi:hypothetical protein
MHNRIARIATIAKIARIARIGAIDFGSCGNYGDFGTSRERRNVSMAASRTMDVHIVATQVAR